MGAGLPIIREMDVPLPKIPSELLLDVLVSHPYQFPDPVQVAGNVSSSATGSPKCWPTRTDDRNFPLLLLSGHYTGWVRAGVDWRRQGRRMRRVAAGTLANGVGSGAELLRTIERQRTAVRSVGGI